MRMTKIVVREKLFSMKKRLAEIQRYGADDKKVKLKVRMRLDEG